MRREIVRNLLALLAAAALLFAGLGWYLDWYQVSSVSALGGRQSVNIDFNSNKIRTDVNKVKKGIEETRHNLRDGGQEAVDSPVEFPPARIPPSGLK